MKKKTEKRLKVLGKIFVCGWELVLIYFGLIQMFLFLLISSVVTWVMASAWLLEQGNVEAYELINNLIFSYVPRLIVFFGIAVIYFLAKPKINKWWENRKVKR